jgi:hypothetical protein
VWVHSGAVLSLVLITALAQPLPSSLYRASREATALVEVELPLITTERVEVRWQKALQSPKVMSMLASRAPIDAPLSLELPQFEVLRSCLRKTDHRLTVKLLVLLNGADLRPNPLPQVTWGLGLETTPGYQALKQALTESFSWVDADRSWAPQRKALASDNTYLRHLAVEFLVQHGASEVIDAAWGAPGSEGRSTNEATARVAPDCKG